MRYKSRQSPEAKEANRTSQRKHHAQTRYGITLEEYDSWFERFPACQLCGSTVKLCLDHDHETGTIRGVLCSSCNTGMGMLGDSPQGLWKAFSYLLGVPTRPDWDAYFSILAKTTAERSDCRRSKVGSIIVDSEHRVVSLGYVGTLPGSPGCLSGACPRGLLSLKDHPRGGSYENCISFHSEANAIKNANSQTEGCTIYVTREPCEDCYILIKEAGITRVVFPQYGA